MSEVGMVSFKATWKGILPLLIFGLTNGTDEGKKIAREELDRMASAADAFNKIGESMDAGAFRGVLARANIEDE